MFASILHKHEEEISAYIGPPMATIPEKDKTIFTPGYISPTQKHFSIKMDLPFSMYGKPSYVVPERNQEPDVSKCDRLNQDVTTPANLEI